jgi:nicotinamidase-related amidase
VINIFHLRFPLGTMSPTALFVIDIQEDLAGDSGSQIPHSIRVREVVTKVLADARKAIDTARAKGEEPPLTIIIVQHEEKPEEGPMVRGSKPWELIFKPREGNNAERVIAKTTRMWSIFSEISILTYLCPAGDTFESNPNLAAQLKSEGVESIVAVGIQSDACVRATSKGAIAAGFAVTLLSGAHSTYDIKTKKAEEIEKEIEEELKGEGVVVVDWSDYKF